MKSKKRYVSLDYLKGFGIVFLIILHQLAWVVFSDNLKGFRYESSKDIFELVFNFIAYTGTSFWGFFFPMIAGASSYFLIKKENFTFKKLLIRVGFLLALGSFMNLLTWGINDVFDWDVLQFIAISVFISYPFIKRAKNLYGLLPVFFLGIFALRMSDVFPFTSYQTQYWYLIIFGDKAGYNFWPFFPWFSLFAAGILIGWIFTFNNKNALKMLSLSGIVLLVISYWQKGIFPVVDLNSMWGVTLFKPSPYFVLAVLGFGFFAMGTIEFLTLKYEFIKSRLKKSVFIYYGRAVLWVYIFSIIFGYKMTLLISLFCENINQALFVVPVFISINLLLSYVVADYICSKNNVEY